MVAIRRTHAGAPAVVLTPPRAVAVYTRHASECFSVVSLVCCAAPCRVQFTLTVMRPTQGLHRSTESITHSSFSTSLMHCMLLQVHLPCSCGVPPLLQTAPHFHRWGSPDLAEGCGAAPHAS